MNGSFGADFYYDYTPINLCQQEQRPNNSNLHARGVAQERRTSENEQFRRLSALLPVSPEIAEHLDKASIIRLAKTAIRLSNEISQWKMSTQNGPIVESNVINLVDGFLCIFAPNFEFLYVSETISQHLGLSQVELCGNSFWNYVHCEDLPAVRLALSQLQDGLLTDLFLNFRMRSTLTKRRSRESPNCSPGYKVVTLEVNNPSCWSSILAFCQPHSAQISNGVRILSNSLVISTNDALQITYTEMNGSTSKRLIGQSFYTLVHPDDLYLVVEMHKKLQMVGSHRTRFLRLILNGLLVDAEVMAIRYNSVKSNKMEKSANSQSRITLLIMQ